MQEHRHSGRGLCPRARNLGTQPARIGVKLVFMASGPGPQGPSRNDILVESASFFASVFMAEAVRSFSPAGIFSPPRCAGGEAPESVAVRRALFLRLCALTFREFLQDLPPQPRDKQLHHFLVCRIQPAGFGRR